MMKIMFLAIFAALVTLHVDVDGKYNIAIKYTYFLDVYKNMSSLHRNNIKSGFFFFNFHTCSARCKPGNIERRLPSGITCDENYSYRDGSVECVRTIGQNDDRLLCYGCTPDVLSKLSKWQ
ncbi:secreted salivary gland peptide, putative [Ixodes scapularis]|uniref:Secreted salivary gland peptide, putative n=1 Tax=Ixodes scapularis TaxID=6945 RepID=B7P9H4_IXOSC|nr:secreted salivary gland peptide, putative [Ixodes scapularis]|eukprot:XP_002404355.1 secreted salivary gland peptide, putative [Ixodes scapularis]